jgi:hypothetical protein
MMLKRSLQSAEVECAHWRALAAQHALANKLELLTLARAQLSRCQTTRDDLAARLLAEEGSALPVS